LGKEFLDMAEKTNIAFPFQEWYKYFNYLPTTNWQRFFNPQIIIGSNTQDQDVETHVLQEVGSYGKQLGIVIRLLSLMALNLDKNKLLPQELKALEEFEVMSREVRKAVDEFKGRKSQPLETQELIDLERTLKVLSTENPEKHKQLVTRLQKLLDETK
jgi:hypothetical protein